MAVEIRLLQEGDESALRMTAPELFDAPLDGNLIREFLADPRHHLAIAIENETAVGMASAVHYIHPDKQPELWVNEVCVAEAYRQQGVGKALLGALFALARQLGCREAWVLTDRANVAAMRLYSSMQGQPTDQVMFTFRLDAGSE